MPGKVRMRHTFSYAQHPTFIFGVGFSIHGVRVESRSLDRRPTLWRQRCGVTPNPGTYTPAIIACIAHIFLFYTMDRTLTSNVNSFGVDVGSEFSQHLQASPSNRRLAPEDKVDLIAWLIDPTTHPTSQKAFSRRNYVRKTFRWDAARNELLAIPKKNGEQERVVVTYDLIMDTVWSVHTRNGHSGWDTTWKDVSSSYYGILRTDVIFLLQRCDVCACDPRKRPKGSGALQIQTESRDDPVPALSDPGDSIHDPTNQAEFSPTSSQIYAHLSSSPRTDYNI
ncbi:hypothetical protein NUW58_g2976 [Xylaria curta]|uniref:Uncharacterized protein n=1 Tax=Xylaria curta TaxID=42375 RepID=A0ACC1PFQ5_9PEZI|nr:hypothetical protein NUW58_g2976 [Xylaria curta]